MNQKGNAALIAIATVAVLLTGLLFLPFGGSLGALREASLSFMLHRPPRFVELTFALDGQPQTLKPGRAIRIKDEQYLELRQVKANTFFKSYLTADVPGFGQANDLTQNLPLAEIRDQLIAAGLKSMPVEIHYMGRKIAQVPIEIDLTEADYRERIRAAAKQNDRLQLLRHAHQSFPANREFLSELEALLLAKGDYQSLSAIYRDIAESDPDNITAYTKLASYYQESGRPDEALRACQHIVNQGRATVATYRRMAYIAGQQGRADQRIAYLKQALALEPGNESIVLDLGTTYEQTGQAGQAVSLYQAAAPAARDKNILVPVINAALARRDYAAAAKSLQQYLRQYPNDAKAWAQLADAAGKQAKTAEQARYYAKAAALAPRDRVILNNLALASERNGNQTQALKAYRQLASLNPADRAVKARIAEIALSQKNWNEAYEAYRDLAAVQPSAANLNGLVKAAVSLRNNDKIIAATGLYLKHKTDERVLVQRGAALENRADGRKGQARLNDLETALGCYRKALSLNRASQAADRIPELKIQIMRLKRES